ncbi:MAG: polysaccharide deacetylase family protein [Caryophanon sp.]|nr:polysaccharide deacetylase family protein [Caryophanon sp.]
MERKPVSEMPKFYASFIAAIGVFIILCIVLYTAFSKPTAELSKTAASPVLPEATVTEAAYPDFPALTNVTEVANDAQFPYTLQYILTGSELTDALLKDDIEQFKKQYIERASNDTTNNLTVETHVTPYMNDYYSFTLHKRILQADAQISSELKHYFYDAQAQKLVTFKQLLEHDEARLATVLASVRQFVQKNAQLATLTSAPFMANNYTPKWEHFSQFTLSKHYLTLSFVTNGTPAIVDVALPVRMVHHLFAEAYRLPAAQMENVIPADYVVDHSKKRVAITFDDGPHETVTPQILDTLKKYNVKATFYVLGQRVVNNPYLARRILDEGHEIGNHTWSHPDLVKQKDEIISDEYNRTTDIIVQATGALPSSFRAPYGSINARVASLVPLKNVLWSIDTLDWKHRDPEQTLQIVNNLLHNNAIILMHDIHQPTADALDSVLASIQAAGYEMVTISELNAYLP